MSWAHLPAGTIPDDDKLSANFRHWKMESKLEQNKGAYREEKEDD